MTIIARIGSALLAATAAVGTCLAADMEVKYLHNLADFSGNMPLVGRIHVDPNENETYVLDGNRVRIFTPSGMETYSFPVDGSQGWPIDLTVEANGDITILAAVAPGTAGVSFQLIRCDFRGSVKRAIPVRLPDELAGFNARTLVARAGRLYVLDAVGLRLVELRADGGFVRGIDLATSLGIEEKERNNLEIGGFAIDGSGRMLFTVPVHFGVVVLHPDFTPAGGFGTKGSGRGKFGVIAGITTDPNGNIYVADAGRSVVHVFDRNFQHQTEFGGYGELPENLVRPSEMALTPNGRLLVSQMKGRGVSVFQISTTGTEQ